jgi:ubiquinone/menaquinone biosynthesis C-methylase UbiE
LGVYRDWMLSWLIHAAMKQETFSVYRRRVIPMAEGRVLEIGVGSGLNLPFYGRHAERVIGIDPSARLLWRARKAAARSPVALELLKCSAEAIPLESRSIDTVVSTWTLCTILNVQRALGELRRVLKPSGRLLFVEHGRSPEPHVWQWQDRLTPVWRCVAGGCHLNRAIGPMIEESGFEIVEMKAGYMTGPKLMTFMYEGSASSSVVIDAHTPHGTVSGLHRHAR